MAHNFTGPLQTGPDLEATPTTQEFALGQVVEGKDASGRWAKYRYVKFVDAVTYVAGHVVVLADADGWDVTNDVSGGSAIAGLHPVGVVFQTTVPAENDYGWVQCAGLATVLAGSASIVAGDYLKVDASTDGAADEATEGTDQNIVGIAMAAISDTATGLVMLQIPGV